MKCESFSCLQFGTSTPSSLNYATRSRRRCRELYRNFFFFWTECRGILKDLNRDSPNSFIHRKGVECSGHDTSLYLTLLIDVQLSSLAATTAYRPCNWNHAAFLISPWQRPLTLPHFKRKCLCDYRRCISMILSSWYWDILLTETLDTVQTRVLIVGSDTDIHYTILYYCELIVKQDCAVISAWVEMLRVLRILFHC